MVGDIFSRIDHGRTADAVVDQIEKLIFDGVLRVGDRLLGERDLAQRFDVIGPIFSQPVFDLIARHRDAAYDYLEYRREVWKASPPLSRR